MSAYLLADVLVTNEAQMQKYREWSTRAMREHGAEILVRGGAIDVLEGDWHPRRVVLLKFKDLAACRAYYESETYTQARRIREGAGVLRIIAVDGVS